MRNLDALYEYIKTIESKVSDTVSGDYLPLTGGTLTGALNGTSIALTGNLTTNGHIYLSNAHYLYGQTTAGVNHIMIGMSTTDNIFIGNSNYANIKDVNIYAGTGSVRMHTSLGNAGLVKSSNGYNLFMPGDDNATYLGASDGRWKNIFTYDVNLAGVSLSAPYTSFEVTAMNPTYVTLSNQLNKYYPHLRLVHIQFVATVKGRAWTAGEFFTIANIPTTYKPAYTTVLPADTTGTRFYSCIVYNNADTSSPGHIRAKASSAITSSDTVTLRVNGWYHLSI